MALRISFLLLAVTLTTSGCSVSARSCGTSDRMATTKKKEGDSKPGFMYRLYISVLAANHEGSASDANFWLAISNRESNGVTVLPSVGEVRYLGHGIAAGQWAKFQTVSEANVNPLSLGGFTLINSMRGANADAEILRVCIVGKDLDDDELWLIADCKVPPYDGNQGRWLRDDPDRNPGEGPALPINIMNMSNWKRVDNEYPFCN